jgi:hypothetical protein
MAMHRPLLLMAVIVLALASLAVARLSASLESAPVTRTASARDVSTVLQYYDAVNEMIATGDPAPLREVLHADITEAGSPGAGPAGHGSLEGNLNWLNAIAPDTGLWQAP